MRLSPALFAAIVVVSGIAVAAPQQRRPNFGSRGVYKARITPHWFGDDRYCWYRNDLAGDAREFVLVDTEAATRAPAFDHERLAKALAGQGIETDAGHLALDALSFDLEHHRLDFTAGGRDWSCDLASYELSARAGREVERASGLEPLAPADGTRRSATSGEETELTFVNDSGAEVEIFWLDEQGRRRSYGRLAPGQRREQHTYVGHVWDVADETGGTLAIFVAIDSPADAVISRERQRPSRRGPRRADEARDRGAAPDGRFTALVRDGNVVLRAADGTETPLTSDGTADVGYGMLDWSPDSKRLVAFRIEPGENKEVYLVESSPPDGGRARPRSRPYPLPGDRFSSFALRLFDVDSKQPVACDVEPVDFGRPRLHWREDGHSFAYEKIDRGHQRYRLIEVDARTGAARNLIDERTKTFIWTAHTESVDVPIVTWLSNGHEIVWASEKDGWRHLDLVDADAGRVKNAITHGEWVVRGIDRIDEERREIWFHASGMNPDQDPYFIHYYRIGLDGTGLVALTEGDGNHAVQYSPQRKYLIDTYSRVDAPPVHELRRVADGRRIVELERASIEELVASGWKPPEVFVAKGRDGKTDIWGIVCRPRDFDPSRKYPILEDIYAGPQGSFVPKTFSASDRYRALNELGFVVVKIDGMGTANRSKAFHDVCWHDLKDAGFADRILWMKAAAAKDPALDLDRVGIFGTSAGGQSAAGALLFHPEFYKAAVANSGCHDNRMDKASWNEQWMGYPVGPWYAESSNIENAARLQGHLMLVVGELDANVPPESTYRFVDALIKADKDFDFLLVPGGGHGAGGAYGQRRLQDFFVRHLQDRKPSAGTSSNSSAPPSTRGDRRGPPSGFQRESFEPDSALRPIVQRYRADRDSLLRYYTIRASPTRQARLTGFYRAWSDALRALKDDALDDAARTDRSHFEDELRQRLAELEQDATLAQKTRPLVPFATAIIDLAEARQRVEDVDPEQTAATLAAAAQQIEAASAAVEPLDASLAAGAKRETDELQSALKEWFRFYDGYDPLVSWWTEAPFRRVDQALQRHGELLDAAAKASNALPTPEGGGAPVGAAVEAPAPELADVEARAADVPDLKRLLAQPRGRVEALLVEYASSRRRSRERGRPGDAERSQDEPEQVAFEAWQARLEQLPFGDLDREDRVDALLFKSLLETQIRRRDHPLPPIPDTPIDGSGIRGRPIGADALEAELRSEMIPYSAEEILAIGEREYAWCRAELERAAREMGFGDDWRGAVEKVKTMHVEPGAQPALIRDLAHEAIDYVTRNDLVTVPPIARETWRMGMMSPERQRVNPFFTGGEVISVSFPIDAMSHEEKLQSMRGNNLPFARATVHHELIPGHHLQGFMNQRYRSYRRLFSTPFWTEGWALYWEMLLYDRGFPKTPEDRIGFLVWRAHRCARIVFSLGFHLGRLAPQQCVDLLVERVGFDPLNAAAEVRRSLEGSYAPLYQAAYMVGGLQFRALHQELVDSGTMTDRAFHDAVLEEGCMPVEMVRALLTHQELEPDHVPCWRF